MKIWIITLPFLCAVGVAMAQGVETEAATDQPVAVAAPAEPAATADKVEEAAKAKAPAKAKSKRRVGKRSPQTLPTGDMRHCLDLKADPAIIRCSETRRKR